MKPKEKIDHESCVLTNDELNIIYEAFSSSYGNIPKNLKLDIYVYDKKLTKIFSKIRGLNDYKKEQDK